MQFFTSPEDLKSWIKSFKTPDEAALNIEGVIGNDQELDVIQSCRSIFKDNDINAANVLFNILSKHNITQIREGKSKMKNKLTKEAQMMRQDSVYGDMDLKVCPKLPFSVGKRLISTYNCRHYCLDSMVFDDDPNRIYCAEALWRRHVMDKFSREFKDKDGKWVGGYINERFQVYNDDGGNNMQLANGERTRKPRPHQYSTERRLEEARGEKLTDLTASSNQFVKLASTEVENKDEHSQKTYEIFDDIIEMKEAGLSDEDILMKVSEHYEKSIIHVAGVLKMATKMLDSHNGKIYSHDNTKMQKEAQVQMPEKTTLVSRKEVEITTIEDGQKTTLKVETPVVIISNKNNENILQIVDGPNTGQTFKLNNPSDLNSSFENIEDLKNGQIQDAADELGLNETGNNVNTDANIENGMNINKNTQEDFPIIEK
jgi:hypothetical protein